MKISKNNVLLFVVIGSIIVVGMSVFSFFMTPRSTESEMVIGRAVDDVNSANIVIQEPPATVSSTVDNLNPNTKLIVPENLSDKRPFLILIENYTIADAEGNVDRTHPPPIPLVKKGVPTPVDVIISSTLPKESGTFYTALEFTYCAPLYQPDDPSRPCLEKNLDVSLPHHIVSLNQHFNVTITAPDNIPSGLYQLGILARTNLYSHETDKQMNGSSTSEPFWIRVV